ncbi:hypothetical protein [Citrobacter freundii]|uniref:hypothetical protein n=1 Tax=Citrobacter freundii TaxID=546 RepID=UPI0018C56DB2|nr:hypothetical protein [Citrobacter freundii]
MATNKYERLVEINEELVRIAGITSYIAHSSATQQDKDEQIAPHMQKHSKLLAEAMKLFP